MARSPRRQSDERVRTIADVARGYFDLDATDRSLLDTASPRRFVPEVWQRRPMDLTIPYTFYPIALPHWIAWMLFLLAMAGGAGVGDL